ncbi:carboxypeptidase [Neorickettsia sp. 179522]|uniref:carboxypeptidase n=1 Tax=Neorickettsia sp. 179522 TaxID=1714371 RepID=UPI0007924192|nr:carboxypeptidase [Neorickettsia sp. 179522]KYH12829.1 carboxypeptidase [Neorickettsia sp. 179522]
MEEYEKLEKIFARIDSLQKTLCFLDFDVRLHSESANEKLTQVITLKEIIHDVATSDELYFLIEQAKLKAKDLNDWQRVNFGFMQDFCARRRGIPFDVVESFTEASFACRAAYAAARKVKDFSLVKEEFKKLIEVVAQIAALYAKDSSVDRYSALLKAYQIDPDHLEQLCIGVSPLLKGKVQGLGEISLNKPQEKGDAKCNHKRVVEKFFPKNVVRVFYSDHFHLSGGENGLKLIMQEGGSAFFPTLLFLLGQGLYIRNLPYDKWRTQPICNPTSISMYAVQGFLFSHFLFEEKNFAQFLGVQEKSEYSSSIMGANKFVALTHLMILFSIEKSLINGEVSVDDIQKLFVEDLSYYFGVNDPHASILDNHHWFFGEFCYYPSYLKGMIASGQIFHVLKSECSGLKEEKSLIRKLVAWLSSNVYTKGARCSMDELITKLTGEPLDCRFFKKFDQ